MSQLNITSLACDQANLYVWGSVLNRYRRKRSKVNASIFDWVILVARTRRRKKKKIAWWRCVHFWTYRLNLNLKWYHSIWSFILKNRVSHIFSSFADILDTTWTIFDQLKVQLIRKTLNMPDFIFKTQNISNLSITRFAQSRNEESHVTHPSA